VYRRTGGGLQIGPAQPIIPGERGEKVGIKSFGVLTAFDEATRLTFAGCTDLPTAVQQAVADLKLVAGVPD